MNRRIILVLLLLTGIFLSLPSCDNFCDNAADEYDLFSIKIRPGFKVYRIDGQGGTELMPSTIVTYQVYKLHCDGHKSQSFEESGKTNSLGVFEVQQSFTSNIYTTHDEVNIQLWVDGDKSFELNLSAGELRGYNGFLNKTFDVEIQ